MIDLKIEKILTDSFKNNKELIAFVFFNGAEDCEDYCTRVGESKECTMSSKEFMDNINGMDYIEKLTGPATEDIGKELWKMVIKDLEGVNIYTLFDAGVRVVFAILDPENIIPEDEIKEI